VPKVPTRGGCLDDSGSESRKINWQRGQFLVLVTKIISIILIVCRIVRELGSPIAALGGLEALIFTAGIGENAGEVRRRVCADIGWLGIVLDDQANIAGGPCISFRFG
jgi:acetate kinase